MITYVVSDLLQSPARVLVNTVNTVGVMGKGIAKDFKKVYPEMFSEYQYLCETKQLDIGKLWLYKTNHKWVLNFPTKKHWRAPSKQEYIEAGLKKLASTYAEKGITSIAFPMLGCGNGGLDWESAVKPMMEKYLSNLPIEIFIHLYRQDPFKPEHRDIMEIKEWLRNQPETLAFNEVWEDIKLLLVEGKQFQTYIDRKLFFASVIKAPEQGLRITIGEKEMFIHVDQLVDLWQHLRGFGFCMDGTMPGGLEIYKPYLIPVLAELPYLRPVLLSKQDVLGTNMEVGLQFIPRADYFQQGLLEPTMEVQPNELSEKTGCRTDKTMFE